VSSVDISAAATELGCSKKFIRDRIKDGALNAHRIAGSRLIRIDRADLDALKQPVAQSQPSQAVEEYIEKLLAEAPPLSDDQLSRLAELLRPARQGGGAA
jgi:excisionase family DNA binding protein